MKGAIEVVRTPSPGFDSRLFLVPKAGGTWRPIIDLSVLKTHIQCPSFKMETCRFSTETFWRLVFSHEWFIIHLQRDEVELEMNSEPRV